MAFSASLIRSMLPRVAFDSYIQDICAMYVRFRLREFRMMRIQVPLGGKFETEGKEEKLMIETFFDLHELLFSARWKH